MEFGLEKSIEVLQATPATLRAMVGNLSEDWTAASGQQDDWGVFDVVGHLIHADETDWIPRAEVILQRGTNRDFPPFDRFGQFERSKGRSLEDLLNDFAAVRTECIRTVKAWDLTDTELEFNGIHPEFGEVTLRQLLSTWVVHDLTHIRQIATVMAKKYEAAVGPWREYLSILK